MQNDVADDVRGMLAWHDLIECWCGYLICQKNDLVGHRYILCGHVTLATGMINVIMSVATMSILFWSFLLILDEFWHETSCIGNVISLPFRAYVEHPKRSLNVILASDFVWMLPCHSSHGYDDIIMLVTTMSILFSWFILIPDEFSHETSCIRKVISLPFCVYVEHSKKSPDVILSSILVWMWPCHNSHGHWWHQ
jgi:hypothetical protein